MPVTSKIPVVPLRGTQTFVGVMSHVWNRPSLTGLEIAWRWLAGIVAIVTLAPIVLGSLGLDVHLTGSAAPAGPINIASLQEITLFQPVVALETLHTVFTSFLLPIAPFQRWAVPMLLVLWITASTLGRTLVLRRLDSTLHARRLAFFALTAIRILALAAFSLLWLRSLTWAAHATILTPVAQHQEPKLVLFCAIVIVATLGLYVAWAVASWPLQLAPLLAMHNNASAFASLRAAFTVSRELRSKLIEANLVMNIVKLALIVLAMVLSASTLAFQTVATQQFFVLWWCGVILLYFAASDYFHVVRAATYLSLHRALTQNPQPPTPNS